MSDGPSGATQVLAHPSVREALGGSLMPEDLRGNYAEARRAAAAAGPFEAILVDALSGRSGAAQRALVALRDQLGPLSDDQQLVWQSLASLIFFRSRNGLAGRVRAEFETTTSGNHSHDVYVRNASGRSGRELIALQALTDMIRYRDMVAMMAYPGWWSDKLLDQPAISPAVSNRELIDEMRGGVAGTVRALEGVSPLPYATSWPVLADADLVRRSGDTVTALASIRNERECCEAAHDLHGMALCWLAEGDARACVIESPATLGLWIDGSNGGTSLSRLELLRVAASEMSAAQHAFAEARDGFVQVGAPRGIAAADLRLAGVAAFGGDHDRAHAYASAAEAGFEAAGDDGQRYLARIHRVLADVARSIPVDPTTVRDIGAWGKGDGDLLHALRLGCMLARAGQRCLLRDACYPPSVRCAQLAELLVRAADAPLAAAQTLEVQSTLHEMIGDHAAAIASAQGAEALLASQCDGAVGGARPVVWRRLESLLRIWYLIAAARNPEPEGLAYIADRIAALARGTSPDPADPADELNAIALPFALQLVADTPAIVSMYRARNLDLAPSSTSRQREAAWQAAEAAVSALPEPRCWQYGGILRLACREFAAAAALFERQANAPAPALPSPLGVAPALVRQIGGYRAQEALASFLACRDPIRARAQLAALIARDGDDWWKRDATPWYTRALCGDLLHLEGDAATALGCYEEACTLLEQQGAALCDDGSRTSFTNSSAAERLFADAADAALALSPPDHARAFGFIERGRARALADLVSDIRVAATGNDPIAGWREASARRDIARALIRRELAAEAPDADRLAQLRHLLDDREREATALEARARERSPRRFQTLASHTAVPSLAEVTGKLPAGILVIELSLVDGVLLGWALTRDGMTRTLRREVDGRELRRNARRFHDACAAEDRSLAVGAWLGDVLLAPFGDAIRAAAQVVFVVTDELAQLPFHALPFDGDALIARVAVSYAPSASLLDRLATVAVDGKPILAVGDPPNMQIRDPDRLEAPRSLPALPGARLEAEDIAGLVPGSRLLIDDASKANVSEALPRFPVVHLAAHGLVDRTSAWRSAILLANGDQLSVADLMGTPFSADLVVLSACSTGTGEVTDGGEVLGLARGLLAAGARAVIVSLWKVIDQPTRLMMGELHRRLQTGMKPAEALRAAQLHVRGLDQTLPRLASLVDPAPTAAAVEVTRRGVAAVADTRRDANVVGQPRPVDGYGHPVCWAPFVLVGV